MNLRTERYQRKENIIKKYGTSKKILKGFQNIVAIFKINSIDFRFFCFYMQGFKDL